jgi:hypothetical protein
MSDITRSTAARKLYEARRALEELPTSEQQTRIARMLGDLDALLPDERDLCRECGAVMAAPWFTDNETWNAVMASPELKVLIICSGCFINRAETVFPRECWTLRRELPGETT